jgi:hypothetical protein
MNGSGGVSSVVDLGIVSTAWTVAIAADFDGNGVADILWRDSSGAVALWLMNTSGGVSSVVGLGTVPTNWVTQ